MKDWRIGDRAHVYIGWGEIVRLLNCWRVILKMDNGGEFIFPINQLSEN